MAGKGVCGKGGDAMIRGFVRHVKSNYGRDRPGVTDAEFTFDGMAQELHNVGPGTVVLLSKAEFDVMAEVVETAKSAALDIANEREWLMKRMAEMQALERRIVERVAELEAKR